jgi:hypothetical protein
MGHSFISLGSGWPSFLLQLLFSCHSKMTLKDGAPRSFDGWHVLCSPSTYLPTSFLSSPLEDDISIILLSLLMMPMKRDPRDEEGTIVHALTKWALGEHTAKNIFGSIDYNKTFIQGTVIVGTLKDGYIRNVPLPRVPRIQSAKLIAPSRCIPEGNTPSRCHCQPLEQSTVLSEYKRKPDRPPVRATPKWYGHFNHIQ